jgi:hypothetical protein
MPGTGRLADGSWVPAFPGQRAPFAEGNQVAVTHGAESERSVAPLAQRIETALLEDADTPDYLRAPSYLPAVRAWARAEAVASLLWGFLAGQDAQAALTETITGEETEESSKGTVKRRSVSRRVVSVLSELHRAETRAMNLRGRLGLDPLSRAKIMKDLGIARQAGGDAIAKLGERGREIRERREAELMLIEGGSGDGAA